MRRIRVNYDPNKTVFVVQEGDDVSRHSIVEFEKPLKVSFISEKTGGYAYVELAV